MGAPPAPASGANPAPAPRLSVVAPFFNEEECLEEFQRRAGAACRAVVGDSYEIVLVNDGSRDRTWDLMRRIAAADPRVVAINLSRNFGQQWAICAGLRLCRGERILVLDADLQDPPELLGEMMARMDAGADVVYGQRTRRDGENAFKKGCAYLFSRLLAGLSEVDIPLDTGDFRLLSRRALDAMNSLPEQHRFLRGMVSWIGFRQEAVAYERPARHAGNTKYSFWKLLRFALDGLCSFSVWPLRLPALLCLGSALAGLALLLYAAASALAGAPVQGWSPLAAATLGLVCVLLLAVGVMAEFLHRLSAESRQRPLYIIQDILRGPHDGS